MVTYTTNYAFALPTKASDDDLWGDPYLNGNFTEVDSVLDLRTQDYNFADYKLVRPTIKDYAETKQDVTAASSTTIDITSGNVIALSHGTNITTLTISNPSPTGSACSLTIVRVKDNSATARTITWPASVKWVGAVAPTLTSSANAVDIISMVTYDAGTTWYASSALNFA